MGLTPRRITALKNKEAAPRDGLRETSAAGQYRLLLAAALQALTRGKSGLNPSDHDIAVLKIPLDIGSPPFNC